MPLEEKINFIEGTDGKTSPLVSQDPFYDLTGQAPPKEDISLPGEHSAIPANVDPKLHVPATPNANDNFVPGIKDYMDVMNIDGLFENKYSPQVDPDYKESIDAIAPFLNNLSYGVDNRTPWDEIGRSASDYDPLTNITGSPNYKTTQGRNEGTLRAFSLGQAYTPEKKNPGYQDPYGFSIRGQNMDRYMYHPKYDDLGFNVFRDNETFYNERSTWAHDMQRTTGQFFQTFGPAFGGAYRTIGDVFRGDWSSGDKRGAKQMANSMRIASSTRGGLGGFVNDFFLNSAYTGGMLASIALEELLFFALTAASTVGAGPSAGGTTPGIVAGVSGMLRGLSRIPKAFSMLKRGKAIKNMLSGLSDITTARAWYNAARGGQRAMMGLANFLAPETLYAMRHLKAAKSAGQNILNMAHASRTFASFYRDIRMYNLALSESKLESGLVENEVFETLYKEFVDKNGRAPSQDELNMMKYNSGRAGLRTLQANFPVIFLSNKIVLDGWIKGPKPISRLMDEYKAGVGRKVYDTGWRKGMRGKDGKKIKGKKWEKLDKQQSWWDWKTRWSNMQKRGLKGNARYMAAGALRYSIPNFTEGMQEVYQEAVAHATEDYFGGTYAEEIRTGMDVLELDLGKENWNKDFWKSWKKGRQSQWFTSEGWNVFASGFLMGGMMGPSSKFMFQTVPNLYRAKTDPVGYKKYQKQQEKLVDQYVNKLNDMYEDPLTYLDPSKMNSAKQKQLNKRMKYASESEDWLDFKDSQQDALFSEIDMLLETGKFGVFQDAIDDYIKMDDDQLTEAFEDNQYIQEGNPEKLRNKFKQIKTKMAEIKKNDAKFKRMFPGKANPELYKYGTQDWITQSIMQAAEQHARRLLVYNKSEMVDAAKRMEEINDWYVNSGPLANVAATDLSVLQSKNKMNQELKRLTDQIELKALTPEEKELKAKLKVKKAALQKLYDVMFAPENQLSLVGQKKKIKIKDKEGRTHEVEVAVDPVADDQGRYNRSPQYLKKLRAPFLNYLKTLAKQSGQPLEVDKVDEMLKMIVDYGHLNGRIGDYQAALDVLMDPEAFYELSGRLSYIINRQWKKYKNSHHKRIKKYISVHGERTAFLKALATYSGPGGPIFPDPEEVEKFLSKDELTLEDLPSTYYQENGIITPETAHPDTWDELQRLLMVQVKLIMGENIDEQVQDEEVVEEVDRILNTDEDLVETEEEKTEAKENQKTLKEFYEEDSVIGENTRAIMRRQYNIYKSRNINNAFVMDFGPWTMHPKLGKKVLQARLEAYDLYSELSIEEQDKYDNFDEWLIDNIRKNPKLTNGILKPLHVNGYDIINKVVVDKQIVEGIVDPIKDEIVSKDVNQGLYLIKYEGDTTDRNGKVQYFYKIIDSEGVNAFDKYANLKLNDSSLKLTDGWTQNDRALAIKVFENLLLSIPQIESYKFEGMSFRHGETIVDTKTGKKYVVASNSTQASLQGYVLLKPMGVKTNDFTINKKILNKKDFEDRGFKKSTEDFSTLDFEKGQQLKIDVNQPVRFWSSEEWGTYSQEDFQDFLRNLTPEGKRKLQIVIKKNPDFNADLLLPDKDLRETTDIVKRSGGKQNNHIRIGTPRFIVTIMSGTKEVARLTGIQDTILMDPTTGKRITAESITEEQMEEIFNMQHVGPGKKIKSRSAALKLIKDNYTDGQIIDEILNQTLANNDSVSINLFDPEKLSEQITDPKLVEKLSKLSLSVTEGNILYQETKGKPAKTDFPNVRYNQFKFVENNEGKLVPVGIDNENSDEQGFYYIMNWFWFSDDLDPSQAGVLEKIEGPPVTNITDPKQLEVIQELAYKERLKFDFVEEMGRYIAVSIMPNGTVTFVELQAEELPIKESDKFVRGLKKRQDQTVSENINKTDKSKVNDDQYNNEVNLNIRNKYYIAGNPGEIFNITIGKFGGIRLFFRRRSGTAEVSGEVTLTPKDMKDVTDTQSFIDKIQEKWSEKMAEEVESGQREVPLTFELYVGSDNRRSSFRYSISLTPTVEEMDGTVATIMPDVRDNITLTIGVNDSAYRQAWRNAQVKGEDTKENKIQEEDQVDTTEDVGPRKIDANFIKYYDPELEGKGWDQVPNTILQYLTNKLGDPKGVAGLSQFEKIVVQETDLISRIEKGEFKKEIKTVSVTDKQKLIREKEEEIKKYKKNNYERLKQKIKTNTKLNKGQQNAEYVSQKMDFLQNDTTLKELEAELSDLKGLTAHKITKDFDGTDAEIWNEFGEWAKTNLPDFITIDDIANLVQKGKNRGVTLGAFVMSAGTISGGMPFLGKVYSSPTGGWHYHESFHAVFRMLLNDSEIAYYLDIAKKQVRSKLRKEGKNLKDELAAMRFQSPVYASLTQEELEDRYYEEYLADKFQAFKTNPKTKTVPKEVKGFFAKLIEWIKSIFERYTNGEASLNKLFRDIDAGKYRNAKVQSNAFTDNISQGVTTSAFKIKTGTITIYKNVLKDGNLVPGEVQKNIYLSASDTNKLVNSIGALYLRRLRDIKGEYIPNLLLREAIDDYIQMYNPERKFYTDEKNGLDYFDIEDELTEKYEALNKEEVKQDIAEEINQWLNLFDIQIDLDSNDLAYQAILEDQNADDGVPSVGDWELETNQLGGFKNFSKWFRQFIATTTIKEADQFGNVYIPSITTEGGVIKESRTEDHVVAVDYIQAYNGLLKAVSNAGTTMEILQGLAMFAETSHHSKAVIDRLFTEMGITDYQSLLDDNTTLPVDKIESANPSIFNQVIKGLQQYTVDYMFIEQNIKKGKTKGHVSIFAANSRDDAHEQLKRWNAAYDAVYWQRRNVTKTLRDSKNAVNQLYNNLNTTATSIDNDTLLTESNEIAQKIFETTGIKLSQGYIRFSILKKIKSNLGESGNLLEADQEKILAAHKNVEHITPEAALYWSGLLGSGRDLFANFDAKENVDDTTESKSTSGIQSRLKLFARGNAAFDETVGTTVFRDPKGNLIYAHQLPTFHLTSVKNLNGGNAKLSAFANGYNKNNNLLQDDSSFRSLSNQGKLKILRLSGSKQVVVNIKDGDIVTIEQEGIPGVTYGDSTPTEFLSSIINTALWNFNPNNGIVKTVKDKNGKNVAVVPSLIRVIEASNTGDFIELGSVHSVEYTNQKKKEFKLTDEYLSRHFRNVESEYNRIISEVQSLENNDNRNIIKGYNDITSLDELDLLKDEPTKARGFKLTNTGDIVTAVLVDKQVKGKRTKFTLDDTIKKELEAMAIAEIPFEQAVKELPIDLVKLMENKLNFEFDQFYEIATELKAIDRLSAAFSTSLKTNKGVINQNVKDSMTAFNFKTNDIKYNLAQIFHSDFINTVDINNLLLGDQAVSMKDSIDKIKRAKAQNAAGPNALSVVGWPEKNIEAISKIKIVTHEDPEHNSQFNLGVSKEERDPRKTGTQDTMDAQIHVTTKGLKHMHFAMGRLTPARLEVYKRIENGEVVNDYDWFGNSDIGSRGLKDANGALNSQKFVYADGLTYLKMSVVPIFRERVSYLKGGEYVARPGKEKLHNLLNKMEAEEAKGGIMMSVPETASKMMKMNVITEADTFDTDRPFDKDGPLQELDARYLRLQQVNPYGKQEIPDVRQMKQLILSEQVDSTPVVIRGSETTVGKLRRQYEKAVGNRLEFKYVNKRNLIYKLKDKKDEDAIYNFLFTNTALQNSENIDVDMYTILQYSINALKASKSKQQMLEFFEVDETGKQKFNLNNSITRSKFEDLYFSFWNDAFAEKQPGTSYTLATSYGNKVIKKVEKLDPKTNQPIKWKVIRDKDWEEMDLAGTAPLIKKEKFDDPVERTFNNLAVNDYYIDDLRHDVIIWDENGKDTGQRGSEFIAPPQFSSAVRFLKAGQPIPEVIARQFGTRVPSQDKHSSVNLILVDFLPNYAGNTAIFPQELIEISGADFDIDQLYTHYKEFYVNKKVVKSSEEIEQEWQEWVSSKQWSEKQQRNINRLKEIPADKFDVVRSKKEFAKAKRDGELSYTPQKTTLGELLVQQGVHDQPKEAYKYNSQYRFNEATGLFDDIHEAELVEYGKEGITIEQEYDEFLRWIMGEFKKPGSTLYLALQKWNSKQGISTKIKPKDISAHPGSPMKKILAVIKENPMIYGALNSISLPTTIESYKSWKKLHNKGKEKGDIMPYTAAYNNRIFDYKFGLLGNKSISEPLKGRDHAIKNEPANLAPLTDKISKQGVLEIIQELIPELKEVLDQSKINIDNLFGKVKAFESNKEGANSIGAAVIPNVIVNVFQTYNISLEENFALELNGLEYDSFGSPYIKDDAGNPDIQQRKQYIISAIITAMTDNAKEQLAAKLGLNKDALAIAVNMTALGVPIKTSILLIKNPTIQEAYALAKNKTKPTDPGVEKYLEDRILELMGQIKDAKNKMIGLPVGNNTLLKSLKKFSNSGYKNIIGNKEYLNDMTERELMEERGIISEFLKARKIKNYSNKMQSLISLLAGTGRNIDTLDNKFEDFDDLGFGINISDPLPRQIPFDARSIINNKDNMLGRYFKIYWEYNKLLPNVFLTRTTPFRSLEIKLFSGLSRNLTRMNDFSKKKVKDDLVSILQLKAYEYQLSLDPKTKISLSNSVLYKSLDGVKGSEIIKKIKEISPDNYFVNFFLYENKKNPKLDLIESNTWVTLEDTQLRDLQLSFLELFKNEDTRDLAYDLIHYTVVRTGLQGKAGSFLRALPSDMLDGPLNAIGRVDDFFKGKVQGTFENVFGISKEQLEKDLDLYYEHISNIKILPRIITGFKGDTNELKALGVKSKPIQKIGNDTLFINGLNEISKLPTAGENKNVIVPAIGLTKEQSRIQKANQSYLASMGFRAKWELLKDGITDDVEEASVINTYFPPIIIRNEQVGKNKVETIYKLDIVWQSKLGENSKVLQKELGAVTGIAAVYRRMDSLKGTNLQWGGGNQIQGEVPLTNTLEVDKKKSIKQLYVPPVVSYDITNPKIKEVNATEKEVKITTEDNKEYSLNNIPSNLKNLNIPPGAKEASKKRRESKDVITVKKDDASSWTLRVDPKTGAVTNVNTGKRLDPRKDTKLINKAKIKSGYTRYKDVMVDGKKYLVTNDGKVINAIPGSKSQGVAVKTTSSLYKKAVMLAAGKKWASIPGKADTQSTSDIDITTLLTNGLLNTKGLKRENIEDAEVFTKRVFTLAESRKVFNFIEDLFIDTYDSEHKASDKFGKRRRSMYFSDTPYTYSGTTRPANKGSDGLQKLIAMITKELGFEEGYFDMILINEYKDGSQKIGFHTDNEPILNNKGKLNPSVVTISFGDERTMVLKGKKTYRIPMKSGLGLIMGKDGQINYKHGILAEESTNKRFSITLRHNAQKSQAVDKVISDTPSIEEAIEEISRIEEQVEVTQEELTPEEVVEETPEETTEETVEEQLSLDLEETTEETTEEKIVEEKPVIKQLSLNFEDTPVMKPAERRFLDWWDGLTTEQKTKVSEGALGKTGPVTGALALEEFRATMSEVDDKLIERLKCYL